MRARLLHLSRQFSVTVPIAQGANSVTLADAGIPFYPQAAFAVTQGNAQIWATLDATTLSIAGGKFNLSGAPLDGAQTLTATFLGLAPGRGPGWGGGAAPPYLMTVPIPVGQDWVLVNGLALPFTPTAAAGYTMSGAAAVNIWVTGVVGLSSFGALYELSGAPVDGNQVLIAAFQGVPAARGRLGEASLPRARNPLAELHDQALCDLEGLIGHPRLKWCGREFPCIPSTLKRGTTIDLGGRLVDIKLSLTVRTAELRRAAQPLTAGKVVCYGMQNYRIAMVGTSAPGDHVHLDLIDPNR